MDKYRLAIGTLVIIIVAAAVAAVAIWFWPYENGEIRTTNEANASETIEQLRADVDTAEARVGELESKLEAASTLLENLIMTEAKKELQQKIAELEEELEAARSAHSSTRHRYWVATERQKIQEIFAPESETPTQ